MLFEARRKAKRLKVSSAVLEASVEIANVDALGNLVDEMFLGAAVLGAKFVSTLQHREVIGNFLLDEVRVASVNVIAQAFEGFLRGAGCNTFCIFPTVFDKMRFWFHP